MSRIITREDVLKLAKMSQLVIAEEELSFYAAQLEARLSYTTCLQTILAQHADLVAQLHEKAAAENVMRDDVVVPTAVEPLLAQAPQREESFFVVPVVVKQTK
jgi:aspartyl/glutamyl-tRNA(Asn/Gln) amidotransferase C subunit